MAGYYPSWEEDWERGRRGGHWLNPNGFTAVRSQRARSVGNAPVPNISVYNYNRADADQLTPSPDRYPRGRSPARRDDAIIGELEALRRDVRHSSRSSNGGGQQWREPSPAYYQNWQLEHIQRDADERLRWERAQQGRRLELERLRERIAREEDEARVKSAEEQIKSALERERLKAEAKAQKEKIEEEELKLKILREQEAANKKRKEEQERAVRDWERKQDEEKREKIEAEKRAIEAYERKKRREKEEEDEWELKLKLKKEKEKEEELQREKEWEFKQQKKKEMADKIKKEQEEKVEAEMHKRLAKFGFQENQIEAMIDPKKAKKLHAGLAPSTALTVQNQHHHKPTYIKIHTDHLSVETLKYYRIPYELDPVDNDYIIILQEMSTSETDILFEHTRRLRKPTQLFIEDRGRHHEHNYAWVRKKERSKSRSRVRSAALFGPF